MPADNPPRKTIPFTQPQWVDNASLYQPHEENCKTCSLPYRTKCTCVACHVCSSSIGSRPAQRHHCRKCWKAVCDGCWSQFRYTEPLSHNGGPRKRVCDECAMYEAIPRLFQYNHIQLEGDSTYTDPINITNAKFPIARYCVENDKDTGEEQVEGSSSEVVVGVDDKEASLPVTSTKNSGCGGRERFLLGAYLLLEATALPRKCCATDICGHRCYAHTCPVCYMPTVTTSPYAERKVRMQFCCTGTFNRSKCIRCTRIQKIMGDVEAKHGENQKQRFVDSFVPKIISDDNDGEKENARVERNLQSVFSQAELGGESFPFLGERNTPAALSEAQSLKTHHRRVLSALISASSAYEYDDYPMTMLAASDAPYAATLYIEECTRHYTITKGPAKTVYISFPGTHDWRTTLVDLRFQRLNVVEYAAGVGVNRSRHVANIEVDQIVTGKGGNGSVLGSCQRAGGSAPPLVEYTGHKLWEYKVHKGFWEEEQRVQAHLSHEKVRKFIEDGYHIVLCGHSLGGAVATLMTLRLLTQELARYQGNITCITFGAPAVGSSKLTRKVQRCGWEKYFHNFIYRADVVPRLMCGRQLHKETYFHVAKIVSEWSSIAKTMWKEWRQGSGATTTASITATPTSTVQAIEGGGTTTTGASSSGAPPGNEEEALARTASQEEVEAVVKEIEAAIRAPAQDEPLPPEEEGDSITTTLAPTPSTAAASSSSSATAEVAQQVAGHIWNRVAEYWNSSSSATTPAAPIDPNAPTPSAPGQKRSRTASNASSTGTATQEAATTAPSAVTTTTITTASDAAPVPVEPPYDGAEQYRELLNGAKLPFDFFGNFHFLFRPTRGAYAHTNCPAAVYYSLKYFEGWSNVQLEDHSLDRYGRALALLPIVKVGPKHHVPEDDDNE